MARWSKARGALLASTLASVVILPVAPGYGAPAGPGVRGSLAMGVSLIEGNTAHAGDDLAALDAFAGRTGRMPASFSIWSDWGGPNAPFPSAELLDGLVARGVRPVLFWQPTHPDVTLEPERYAYERVVAGDWDGYLVGWATDASNWGGRIVVRWAHEMNAPWFPWAMGKVGNTPEGFRAAWRHVVTLVRAIAPEVRFLWAPNAPCDKGCVDFAALYPGDDVVDLVGFDAYAWDTSSPPDMVSLYAPAMAELRAITDRPVVVGETAAAGPTDGRATWVEEGYRGVRQAYPEIAGVIWFHVDMRFADHPDWRLHDDDGSLAAYAALLADPRFMGMLDPAPTEDGASAAGAGRHGASSP